MGGGRIVTEGSFHEQVRQTSVRSSLGIAESALGQRDELHDPESLSVLFSMPNLSKYHTRKSQAISLTFEKASATII